MLIRLYSKFGAGGEQKAWSGYVMVSQWQAQRFAGHFGLDMAKTHVIGMPCRQPFWIFRPALHGLKRETLRPVLLQHALSRAGCFAANVFRHSSKGAGC